MADLYAILDWPHPSGLDIADVARGLLGASLPALGCAQARKSCATFNT